MSPPAINWGINSASFHCCLSWVVSYDFCKLFPRYKWHAPEGLWFIFYVYWFLSPEQLSKSSLKKIVFGEEPCSCYLPSAMGSGWCSKLHPSLPSFPPFFTLSKCWLSWVMLLSLTSLNADVYCSAPCWCKKLEVERDTRCHLSPGLTPTKQAIALVSSGLAGLQHRGGFGGLGAPHP